MRARLGVAITPAAVAVTAARGNSIFWRRTFPVESGQSLDELFARAFAVVPRDGRTWRAHVVIESRLVRLKRPYGLPTDASLDAVRRLFNAAPERFFILPAPATILVARIPTSATGGSDIVCALYDRSLLTVAQSAGRAAGVRVRAIMPASLLVPPAARDVHAMAELAATSGVPPLAWMPRRDPQRQERRSLLRRWMYIGAVSCFAIAAVIVPALRQRAYARRVVVAIAQMSDSLRQGRELDARIARDDELLRVVRRAQVERNASFRLLAEVARAVPEPGSITVLRLDSLGGALSATGPRLGEIVSRLAALPDVRDARLIGAVRNGGDEAAGTIEFHRAVAARPTRGREP